jgi:uncharacterized protein YecT (DUF1311 family)
MLYGKRVPRARQYFRMSLLAALLVSARLSAAGGDASCQQPRSPGYEACVAQANGVTAEMRRCANDELQRQTLRLRQALQLVMASPRISTARKTELEVDDMGEKAWEESRDRSCIAEARHDAPSGTLAPFLATDCAVCQTAERADRLAAVASQQ